MAVNGEQENNPSFVRSGIEKSVPWIHRLLICTFVVHKPHGRGQVSINWESPAQFKIQIKPQVSDQAQGFVRPDHGPNCLQLLYLYQQNILVGQ